MTASSFAHLFHDRVAKTPGRLAFEFREGDAWSTLSWRQVGDRVRDVAGGLHELGLEKGDRCGIVAGTRIEWILADVGILCGGFATTTVYVSNTAEEASYILGHSECRVCFAEDNDQVAKLVAERANLPRLERIVVMDGEGSDDGWVLSWAEFVRRGARWNAEHAGEYDKRARAVGPSDLATLIYTSGTTGKPKGVVLTHDCWVFEAESAEADLRDHIKADEKQYLFLPLAHSFGKVLEICSIHLGMPTTVEGDIQFIVQGLQQSKPTFMGAVPRVFEKVYNSIVTQAKAAGAFRYRVFRWAVAVGQEWTQASLHGRVGLGLRVRHGIADRLVYRKIRDRLGGRIRYFLSGGAPLAPEIARFFYAAGIFIGEGYGLTETSAGAVINRIDDFRFGTVGKPAKGVGVKIGEDGEILIRGRNVMREYYKDPVRTAQTFTSDGWFRTGDVGEFDADGFLKITGRIKDLIITAGGKNIAPLNIENRVKATSPWVSEVVMHGDKRNFCVALVSLDEEALVAWARQNQRRVLDYAGFAADPEVHAMVMGDIEAVNAHLSSYETIKKIHLLKQPLSIETGELTPSHKVKRRVVEARNQDVLDRFYTGTVEVL